MLALYTAVSGYGKAPFSADHQVNCIAVFSNRRLGDLLFCTPAIRSLRTRYPAARIILITSSFHARWVSAGEHFDEVMVMDNTFASMRKVIPALKSRHPDISVILHARAPYDVVASLLSGCRHLFKDYYTNEPQGMDKWLTHCTRGRGVHIIHRKMALVKALGCCTENPAMFVPVTVKPKEKSEDAVLFGFQMGASKKRCRWPVSSFVSLMRALRTSYPGCQFVLIGAPEEQELGSEFLFRLDHQERAAIDNQIGQTSMTELVALILSMDLLISNDTGPLHLAVAARTCTVSLFTLTNPAENGPSQDPELHTIIYAAPEAHDEQPMDKITVDAVVQAVNSLLLTTSYGPTSNRNDDDG